MDVIIVATLALAGLLQFRTARRIARSPMGSENSGRWMVRVRQALGLICMVAALLWLLLQVLLF